MINLLPLEANEQISTILPVREFDENHYVFMVTQEGTVKKVGITEFSKLRAHGKRAVELLEGDRLVGVGITNGQREVLLMTNTGMASRFSEEDIRPMGCTARGVRGIRLKEGQFVVSALILDPESTILSVTANGYGQRTQPERYRLTHRGGQGVRAIQTNERNGSVVGAVQVTDQDEILLITDQGTLVRTRAKEISVVGRNTQGVRLINLNEGESLVSVESITGEFDNDDETSI
jgi:DNA gyrase subunit A